MSDPSFRREADEAPVPPPTAYIHMYIQSIHCLPCESCALEKVEGAKLRASWQRCRPCCIVHGPCHYIASEYLMDGGWGLSSE